MPAVAPRSAEAQSAAPFEELVQVRPVVDLGTDGCLWPQEMNVIR